MKCFLIVSVLMASILAGTSFYDLQFETIDGQNVQTSAYRGKKVIVAVCNATEKGIRLVKYLDSVQKANDTVRVIIVPTGDFAGQSDVQSVKTLKKNVSVVVTKPFKVKKENGKQQHSLFVWLTQSAENSHFNMDVSDEGQLFIVSSKGTLHAVFPQDTPLRLLSRVINQPFAE